jgi:predicted RNA-binding Zn-ribbon protein involved in translation (DUF1610 family)
MKCPDCGYVMDRQRQRAYDMATYKCPNCTKSITKNARFKEEKQPTQSQYCRNVWWYPQGYLHDEEPLEEGWYFYDEAQLLGGGPYKNEITAISAINEYAARLSLPGDWD